MNQPQTNETVARKDKKLFKILVIMAWGFVLCVNTWTKSLEQFLDFKSLGFTWNPSPDFVSFFYFYDLTLIHQDFFIVKLGHFLGFAVMDLLLYWLFKNHKRAILISFAFAFFTEFFQLFFGRDGRLYDLGIDTLGILFVSFLLSVFGRKVHG
ncbi:VanZ family protein [Peribacillus sp. B-H-3]|uniref:VanZ family protein n=1 Tax=Peribacillus sp. B-H-3 TaxID=3400420 RepID=UPI003B0225E1